MGVTDYNKKIIDEFRSNQGVVGGPFAGAQLLLLHTIGAKSGEARINPLAYFKKDNDMLIVASFAGADQNPPWYYNLLANPNVTIEVGTETINATAEVVEEPDRSTYYAEIAARSDAFAQYQQKTSRTIPIIRLVRQ
jgi:deazaflavin-dependent oxidoreductase (nitroreductase family)